MLFLTQKWNISSWNQIEKKKKHECGGAAVSLTVASEDLQFKGVTCTLSSCINGLAVYLCVSTDVKSNFYTSCVYVRCCALSGNGDILWYYTHPYLWSCFGVASVNDWCSVPPTSVCIKCIKCWLKTTHISPGRLRSCVPCEIQV